MSFPYTTVLVVGATSGIGLALAEQLISNGSHVIAVGRRQENLDALVQQHGRHKVSSVQFDITDLKAIPSFADSITKAHPTLDSVILNSGIQRPYDFTKPESINLENLDLEISTNYTSYIHLLTAFLPHLQSLPQKSSLIFTTSGLALSPILRCPNYCATKAALHHLILTLRAQLSLSHPHLKIVEILPPAVQTELHDERHQPDLKDGRSFGMPIEQFVAEAWEGLCSGETDVPVGTSKGPYAGWEGERRKQFEAMVGKMRKNGV